MFSIIADGFGLRLNNYNGVLPGTPQVRPKSQIYPPERDEKHARPFHMGVPPPGFL